MSQFLIDEENARAQIDEFCEWYGIDWQDNEEVAKAEGVNAYPVIMRRLVRTVQKGQIEIAKEEHPKGGDTIVIIQHLEHPLDGGAMSSITYHEVTGATKASVKVPKDANDTKATFAALAVMAKEPPKTFEALRGGDIGVAQLVGFLYSQI